MSKLLINGVAPVEACGFCKARRKAQDQVIAEFQKKFQRSVEMFMAPQQPHEITGPKDLTEHFNAWEKVSRKSAKQQRKAR